MANLTEILSELSLDELQRLEQVIALAAPRARIDEVDWPAVVAAIRSPETVRRRESSNRPAPRARRMTPCEDHSGGRKYELTLSLSLEEASRQYEAECARVEAMAVRGMSYEDAWDQIRRDARHCCPEAPEELDSDGDNDGGGTPRRRRRMRRRNR